MSSSCPVTYIWGALSRRSTPNIQLSQINVNRCYNLCIKLRRSCDLLGLFVCFFVCLSVSPSLPLVRFGQLLHYADKRFVNISQVYIETNVQIRYVTVKNVNFIHAYFCEATDSPTERIVLLNEVSNTNHFGSISDSLGRGRESMHA